MGFGDWLSWFAALGSVVLSLAGTLPAGVVYCQINRRRAGDGSLSFTA